MDNTLTVAGSTNQASPIQTHAYDNIQATISATESLGKWIAASGMFGCERVEQGNILALQCLTERKAPLEMAKHYHLIQGKLTMRSDAMLAEYRARGGKVKWLSFDEKLAKAQWLYDGNDLELQYSLEEAKTAGLVKPGSSWIKHPADMLRARLISKAIRMIAPEVVAGVYTPEEVSDFDSKPARAPRPVEPPTVLLKPRDTSHEAPLPQIVRSTKPPEVPGVPAPTAAVLPATTEDDNPPTIDVEVFPPTNNESRDDSDALAPVKHTVEEICEGAGVTAFALSWLHSKRWIKQDQGFEGLSPKRVSQILAKPGKFVTEVTKKND